MKIVCTEDLPCAREAFATLGEVEVFPERVLTPGQVRGAEILAVRSTTRVGRGLLEESGVRFVGTATIGVDHLDLDWFQRAGIAWCSAPGCNANSVSEYFVAALLALGRRHGFTLAGRTLGIVGVGNVGARIREKAEILGLKVLLNDPPRQRATGETIYQPLERLLAESEILTLHVPLEKAGDDPTFHMAGREFFGRLREGCLFLNAARGAVVDTEALLAAMEGGKAPHAVLDAWEGEPSYRKELLERVDLGTPHIAGHSYEGKVVGTWMVYREACRFLGREPTWDPSEHLRAMRPGNPPPVLKAQAAGRPVEAVLEELVRGAYAIEKDDRDLRATLGEEAEARARGFNRLRKQYAIRREFAWFRAEVEGAPPALREKIQKLGFRMD